MQAEATELLAMRMLSQDLTPVSCRHTRAVAAVCHMLSGDSLRTGAPSPASTTNLPHSHPVWGSGALVSRGRQLAEPALAPKAVP